MNEGGPVPSESLTQRMEDSLRVINEAFDLYRPNELAVSYNGGKDSILLLHLLARALNRRNDGHTLSDLVSIYFRLDDSFPEVDQFMGDTAKEWKLNMIYLGDFQEGLTKLQEDHTDVKAIFMGTRRVDPGAETMKPFEPTDNGWPDFMRINPILDWTYSEVWEYILSENLKYCSLYDQGYTSIGQTRNTVPNPCLAYTTEFGETAYLPAYKLTDGSKEREGRSKRQ